MGERSDTVRVLHVDDDPGLADVAATFLERQDGRVTVRSATSAADGLDGLASDEVDCVISDYDMPDRNGIDFLEGVRETYPDLPFILYTGKGSEAVFDAVDTTGKDGTGFGLSIIERIAEARGWEVRVAGGSAGGAGFEVTGVEFVEG